MSRLKQSLASGLPGCLRILALCLLFGIPQTGPAQTGLAAIETTFKFVAGSLQRLQRTGQFDPELGIDESARQEFVALLRVAYDEFKYGLEADGRFCRFYLDPENGRMELEERAVIALNYIEPLPDRLRRYQSVAERFHMTLEQRFGGRASDRVRQQSAQAVSYEYLPTRDLDGAEAVHLADTFCGG